VAFGDEGEKKSGDGHTSTKTDGRASRRVLFGDTRELEREIDSANDQRYDDG
jgi:hypothetical protein